MDENLSALITEKRNTRSRDIDQMSTNEILRVMNEEDQTVAVAVQQCMPEIEKAVDLVYQALKKGGRLIYLGAGTSGRLGVIDAAECPPTFRTDPELVKGIMAGGKQAMFTAIEGAEDDLMAGIEDLKGEALTSQDVVIGITASGRTPYVVSAISYAKTLGAKTIGLSCNKDCLLSKEADLSIEAIVGPEVLTGSTRLKAATAHKMILNMISTATMIKLGKVYENLMVDVNASNFKLKERAKSIVTTVTGVTDEEAENVLDQANQDVKAAIVMIEAKVTFPQSKQLLKVGEGFVRKAIELGKQEGSKEV